MKIIRTFSTTAQLVNYLRYLYNDSYTPDEYYKKLEDLAENGCEVNGESWDYTDLCEML